MQGFHRQLALACLTVVAGTTAAQGEQLEGNWSITVGEDPSSYEVVAALQQDSANTIKDEYATKDVTPRLAFRVRQ